MSDETRIVKDNDLEEVSGGRTEEEYYAEYAKFNLLDTEEHLLEGKPCRDCGWGKLQFLRYQPGPFGNREGVYYCSTCHEYTITVLRK